MSFDSPDQKRLDEINIEEVELLKKSFSYFCAHGKADDDIQYNLYLLKEEKIAITERMKNNGKV